MATSFIADASQYPENLGQNAFWNEDLTDYRQRLDEKSDDLFADSLKADLELLQLWTGETPNFEEKVLKTDTRLFQLLSEYAEYSDKPKCQHFFLKANKSTTRLKLTGSMARVLLSHHRVMPVFLEFLFTFQRRAHKKHFDFSGFRASESWSDSPSLPQFQLCYSLRCIERAPKPEEWPWSMRPTVVYHSFDLQSGDAVWINIKGNTQISPRIKSLVKASAPSDPAIMGDSMGAFRATLVTHLVYCEWASERWAAYLGFLEDELQDRTRYALLAGIPRPRPKSQQIHPVDPSRRTQTAPLLRRQSTLSSLARAGTRHIVRRFSFRPQPDQGGSPTIPEETELNSQDETVQGDIYDDPEEDFTYDDLRAIQHIEDQANVTVLAIRSNISILNELLEFYRNLEKSDAYRNTLSNSCDPALRRFFTRLSSIISDLKLHQSRVETLLQMLADRKALLLQLFAHRNMSASKDLTTRAQISAEKMQALTTHMKHIALKTESETIFMRIITVVALLFLPGTFVATVMSTDIMKFQNDNALIHRFSWQALLTYLGITALFMAVTLWAAIRYKRREQDKLKRKREAAEKLDPELGLLSDT